MTPEVHNWLWSLHIKVDLSRKDMRLELFQLWFFLYLSMLRSKIKTRQKDIPSCKKIFMSSQKIFMSSQKTFLSNKETFSSRREIFPPKKYTSCQRNKKYSHQAQKNIPVQQKDDYFKQKDICTRKKYISFKQKDNPLKQNA